MFFYLCNMFWVIMLKRKLILLLFIIFPSLFCYSIEVIDSKEFKLDIEAEVKSGYKYQVTEFPGISSFELYSADLGLKSEVMDKLDLSLSLDFSEFEDGVLTSKVLKSAYSQYSFHDYFKIRLGQFKPGFGGENDLKKYPHLKSSEASKSLSVERSRGVQLSGSKILDSLSYKIGLFNSGDYTEEGNSDGHHFATAKVEYKLKKKKDYEFKTGYSFYYGTHDTLKQSLFLLFSKNIKSDFKLFLFTEYMEQRYFHYHWDNSLFFSSGLRFKDLEGALYCEYYDENIGNDGEGDKINPGVGFNFYRMDDNSVFRIHYNFDYLYSIPPNRTDRFSDHEIAFIMEARI